MGEEKKQGELKKVLGLGDLMGNRYGQIIGSCNYVTDRYFALR